jgi:hypothetical protein
LQTRENLKQEISLKKRADKAARESAELLAVKANMGNKFLDKKPAMDVP